MAKTTWGVKGLFPLITVRLHSITEMSQSRNKEAGMKADSIEEHCLLACSASFLIQSRNTSPGMVASMVN